MTTSNKPISVPSLLNQAAQERPNDLARRDPLFSWDQVQTSEILKWRETTWKELEELTDAGAFLFGDRGWPKRGKDEQRTTEPIKVAALLTTELDSMVALNSLIKRGNSVLLLSPRNTVSVLVDMLVHQRTTRIAYAPAYQAIARSVGDELAKRNVGLAPELLPIPSQKELDERKMTCGVFPYELDDEFEWTQPCFYIHTSGSSGDMPTICPYTHEILVQCSRTMAAGLPPGLTHLSLAPLFHLMLHIRGPVHCALAQHTVTSAPFGPPPSASHLAALISKSHCNYASIVPQLLESLVDAPGGIESLKHLKWITFGGASLSKRAQRAFDDAGVNYFSSYGSSEVWGVANGNPQRWPKGAQLDRDWITSINLHRVEFKPYAKASDGIPDLYELVVFEDGIPCSVRNIPGGRATGDLVERHSDYPDWFRIWGRKSAVVVLANGENAPVKLLEEALEADPWVKAALIFGTGRPQIGVLIEGDGGHELDTMRKKLWPCVERVNAKLPDFAKLFQNMILFTSPDKAIPRTDKGTPKRQLALRMYEEEIDRLYASAAAGSGSLVRLESLDQESLLKMVLEILTKIYGAEEDIKSDTSLTLELGQDSLRATMTRTSIVASLRVAAESGKFPELASFTPGDVSPQIAYEFSTPATLANALHALIKGRTPGAEESNVELMHSLIKKYSDRLKSKHQRNDKARKTGDIEETSADSGRSTKKIKVLLTGSTGAFGTCLLEQLVDNANVHEIICVIRSASSDQSALQARQIAAFSSKNLDPSPAHSPKVRYLHGSPSEQHLKIPEDVTAIIHSAWSVNFNLSLQDYVPEIEGTVRLLEHCQRTGARLVFASSVATVMGAPSQGSVPRLVDEDDDAPLEWATLGYGRSKAVVEKIISLSVKEAGVEAVSIRCGQVTGDFRSGAWNESEWAPSVFRSAAALEALPDDMGTVDWVIMNDAMRVLVAAAVERDVISATSASGTNVVNLANPNKTPWISIVKAFQAHMSTSVQVIPTQEWFTRLLDAQKHAEEKGDIERASARVPALKLLSRFQARVQQATTKSPMPLLQVKEAIRLSQEQLLSAQTIDERLAGLYLHFWASQHGK
ncbi:hypothetical protein A4X13_0g1038 [Tilletia indica]|uniref:Carrier domain-containing protein n=1 Tax=Tilletia indica TaxID=43049 RepID=A0A177TWA6_9BASI|nr:hypothetical protein A4X13_0g1038 [Tilletia indica]